MCASMLVCAYAPQCVRVCESDREGERDSLAERERERGRYGRVTHLLKTAKAFSYQQSNCYKLQIQKKKKSRKAGEN